MTHKRDLLRREKSADSSLRRNESDQAWFKPSTRVKIESDRDNMLAQRAINELKALGIWENPTLAEGDE